MDETRLFTCLIRFENQCSEQLLEAMNGLPEGEQHTFKLFGHILESQLIWLARLAGDSEVREKWWPSVDRAGCRDLQSRTTAAWEGFLEGLGPERLGQSVSYRSLNGLTASVVVRDILVQLIVSAAHHRGQITLEMRKHGLNAPLPNYLSFARNGTEWKPLCG